MRRFQTAGSACRWSEVLGSGPTILKAAYTAGGVWALRRLLYKPMLRGLRAPRLAHSQGSGEQALAGDRVREVRIPGPRGRVLFGWLVSPPASAELTQQRQPISGDIGVLAQPGQTGGDVFGTAWHRGEGFVVAAPVAARIDERHGEAGGMQRWNHGPHHGGVDTPAMHHQHRWRRTSEKRPPYPVLGWYVMRHVQRVIGVSFDDIAPLVTLARVRCPTLLVHGRAYRTVPVDDAQRLLAVSRRARLLLVYADHDLSDAMASHAQTLVDFLRGACAEPAAVLSHGVA